MATIITDLYQCRSIYLHYTDRSHIAALQPEPRRSVRMAGTARFTAPLHHPALVCPDVYVYARRSPAYSFQYALAVLVRCLIPELFLCQTLTGCIHLRRNLRRTALYDRLQHLPLFPSDDGILFHAGSIGIRTRYRGGYRLSGT